MYMTDTFCSFTSKCHFQELLPSVRVGQYKIDGMNTFRRLPARRDLILGRLRPFQFLAKDGLENLALTGKIEGKRGRGRKWTLWMTSLICMDSRERNKT